MKWITRERPKIDRVACPWLIRRFIDPVAEFIFVPPDRVLSTARTEDGIPFDVPGVELGHVGEQCSFDAFLRIYGLQDAALQRLALVVRAADTGRFDLSSQAAGLLAISVGLTINFSNDQDVLAQGFVIYDALYAWCQRDVRQAAPVQ